MVYKENWWELFPKEMRQYLPVTRKMKNREPTLVRMFVIHGHEDKPIKIYGPDLSKRERMERSKTRKELRNNMLAKKAAKIEVCSGSQSTLREFFLPKDVKGKYCR